VSVALHELMHGLGYVAGFRIDEDGLGAYPPNAPVFARRVVNQSGQNLTNAALFPNPSAALLDQMRPGIGKLRWEGPNGVAAAGGTQPILYSPATFSPGSSIAHLDEGTYPPGNLNALMTPTIGSGQAVHDPGPISRGMLTDLGWTVVSGTSAAPPGDFDGDGVTDIAVFRPSNGVWLVRDVGNFSWGASGDVPVPGDYDGDGSADVAVFRPSTGNWIIRGVGTQFWGNPGDVPVPANFDGDEDVDVAVYRPSNGRWLVKGVGNFSWGAAADVPVPGDFNGDGSADVAVFRPSTGNWIILGVGTVSWGRVADVPLVLPYAVARTLA
jgi:hypothetical protein